MKPSLENTRSYLTTHRDTLTTIAIVAVILLVVVGLLVALVLRDKPRVVYQPVSACSLLSTSDAKDLMGKMTMRTIDTKPVVKEHVATSQCGYADGSTDVENAVVAALMVRSGIDDEGVAQNNTEFAQSLLTEDIQILRQLGDRAYFDNTKGQLNILDGNNWMILSYGVGSDPSANTLESTIDVAMKVLDPSRLRQLPKF